ncbi:MAG: HTH domain-containing protein, partial [Nitrospirae bacterium]|nr:HTH domain-containing protein [Nitrospirota bacterium]
MSYKFDSLIMILNRIDSGGPVTVHSLMDGLEISDRTVYRYLQTLQVAGYPIVYDRQKESYVFADNFRLRKPNLSVEEQLAFALARNLLGSFGAGMQKSLVSIEDKLSSAKTDLPRHIVLTADKPTPVVTEHF